MQDSSQQVNEYLSDPLLIAYYKFWNVWADDQRNIEIIFELNVKLSLIEYAHAVSCSTEFLENIKAWDYSVIELIWLD